MRAVEPDSEPTQSIVIRRPPHRRESAETISRVAHAVKEPLQAIVGRIDLMRLGRFGALEPDQMRAIERIESATAELERGIEAMVTLLMQRVGPSTRPEPIEIRPMIVSILARLERQGVTAGARVAHELPDELPAVHGRRPVIERLLDGLVRTALAESPALTVRAGTARAEDRNFVHVELHGEATPDRPTGRPRLAPLFELLVAAEGGRLAVRPGESGARTMVVALPVAEEIE